MAARSRADSGSAEACARERRPRRLQRQESLGTADSGGSREGGGHSRGAAGAWAAGPGWASQLAGRGLGDSDKGASAFIPAPSIHASQGQMCFSHSLEAHCLW